MLLLSLKSPLVLLADLRLLLGCEIILDVKNLADLLRSLVLDHVGNSLASKVEQSLDVEVVCSQDEVEEGGPVDLDKLSVKALEVLDGGGGCSGGTSLDAVGSFSEVHNWLGSSSYATHEGW